MEHWFDDLARSLATRRSRRAALRLAAGTAGAALLAAIDPRQALAGPVSDCVQFCNTIPPGPARGACNADCGQTGGSGGLFQQCGGDASRLCVATGGAVSCCRTDQICASGTCQCPPALPNECSGRCTNLTFDFQNCGACAQACHSSFKACINGQCVCPFGHTLCGGVCRFDFTSDPQNCGACGNVCPPTAPSCCNGSCVNAKTDPENCGGCFLLCPSGQSCVNGACKLVCPSGQDECLGSCCPAATPTCCGQSCVDLKTNRFSCGTCGNSCPLGQDCVNGVCQKVCPTGQIACGNVCVNPQTDPNNCGACGVSCGTGHCVNGACSPCPAGVTVCGANCCAAGTVCCENTLPGCAPLGEQRCADLSTDHCNCGACNNPCPLVFETTPIIGCPGVGSLSRCCGGACVTPRSDPNNCGGCGIVCGAGQICCNGRCCASDKCCGIDRCCCAGNCVAGFCIN